MSVQILFGEDKTLGMYEDGAIVSCDAETSVTVIGDTVAVDQFHIEVIGQPSAATGTQQTPTTIDALEYGVPIWFYIGNELFGKFYFSAAERTSSTHYSITAISAMGLLESSDCLGGVYDNATVEEIAEDIIGDSMSYTVEEQVADIPVKGWLPISTKKEALHQLMLAIGADVKKDSNGDMLICFNNGNTSKTIPDSRMFIDGTVLRNAQATEVDVTEHTFSANATDTVVTLYDNTNGDEATNAFVSFSDAPVHSITCTGTLTVSSSNCNYAIVSGTGKLTGKKYTHSTKVTKAIDSSATGSPNVATVDAGTLISDLNSGNVAQRLLAYYKSAETITADIIVDGEKSGDKVEITTPFGESASAYIKSMDIIGGGIVSAKCEFITGYAPCFQGNTYTTSVVLTGSGTYTVPEGKNYITAILIGGGQGGQGGLRGNNGISGSNTGTTNLRHGAGAGGAGGSGGNGGDGGKVFQTVIGVTGGQTFQYACGTGGAGGASNGGTGTVGTHTTFGTYDSDSGAVAASGAKNRYTGITYGSKGPIGVAGSAGGAGGGADYSWQNNGSAGSNHSTYTGGAGGAAASNVKSYNTSRIGGSGGGGAANGANGGAAGNSSAIAYTPYSVSPGNGGDGANATIPGSDATVYGAGGQGGSGGGGGGGWPAAYLSNSNAEYNTSGRRVGNGGNGSAGGAGANGCIILYI